MNTLINLLGCGCSEQSVLSDVAIRSESFGETQRLLFMKLYDDTGALNTIPAATLKSKSALAALRGAIDHTKIVFSPVVHEPSTSPGGARLDGGVGTTAGGVEEVVGIDPTEVSFVMRNVRQDTVTLLRKFGCTPIGVIRFDACGNAEGIVDDHDAPTTIMPVPVNTLFVGDKSHGNGQSAEKNVLSFKHIGGWSEKVGVVKADDPTLALNPLLDFLT